MLKDTIAHREVHHKKHVHREPIPHQQMLQVAQHVHLELILIQVQQAVHHVLKDPTHQTAEVHHAQSALQAIILTPEQAAVLNVLQDIIQVPGLVVVLNALQAIILTPEQAVVLNAQINSNTASNATTLNVQSVRMGMNQVRMERSVRRRGVRIRLLR